MRALSLCALMLFAGCLDEATASTTAAVGEPAAGSDHDCPPPPQEALDACASSESGATCAFDVDGHHVDGTCRSPSPDLPLACAPDRPPPPQAAIDTCASSTSGATCAFDLDGHHVDGTCKSPSVDVPLACAPTNPPPPR